MHKKVLAKGFRFKFNNIYIYILPLESNLKVGIISSHISSQSNLSVNITKKAFHKAVARNKIKRKFIEYFRLNRFWIDKYHIFIRVTQIKSKKAFDINQFDKDFKSIEIFDAKN